MHKSGNPTDLRQLTVGIAYLLGCFRDFQALGGIEMALLANKIFGLQLVETAFAPILAIHEQWGYGSKSIPAFRSVIAESLLLNWSPYASDLTHAHLTQVYTALTPIPDRRAMLYRLSRILVHLGLLEETLLLAGGLPPTFRSLEKLFSE
jgi:hypothetical protein